jgi:hypothetical protein
MLVPPGSDRPEVLKKREGGGVQPVTERDRGTEYDSGESRRGEAMQIYRHDSYHQRRDSYHKRHDSYDMERVGEGKLYGYRCINVVPGESASAGVTHIIHTRHDSYHKRHDSCHKRHGS